MAYAIQLTIGTGNKVSINYQSQEVSVSLTYQLERHETDVLQVVQEKAVEVAQAHQAAWQRIRDAKVESSQVENVKVEAAQASCQTSPNSGATLPLDGEPSPAWSAHDVSFAQDQTAMDTVVTEGQQAALRAILSHIGWSEEQMRDYLITHCSGASIERTSIEQLIPNPVD